MGMVAGKLLDVDVFELSYGWMSYREQHDEGSRVNKHRDIDGERAKSL